MKRYLIAIMAVIFIAVAVIAEAAGYTGNDYLNLSKAERLDMMTRFKKNAAKKGVTISKLPLYYCKKLDNVYARHPDMANKPLEDTLKMLIVMEYDWSEPGVNKDALAKQVLGDELYKSNKARLAGKK